MAKFNIKRVEALGEFEYEKISSRGAAYPQKVVASIDDIDGKQLFNLRTWFKPANSDEWKAGKGFSCSVGQKEAIRNLLAEVLDKWK
jgi:hypothetical protein